MQEGASEQHPSDMDLWVSHGVLPNEVLLNTHNLCRARREPGNLSVLDEELGEVLCVC